MKKGWTLIIGSDLSICFTTQSQTGILGTLTLYSTKYTQDCYMKFDKIIT